MKDIYKILLLSALIAACGKEVETTKYKPVWMEREEMDASLEVDIPRAYNNTGKIYYAHPLVFIVENFEGIHIIDNSDPHNPVKEAFVRVPGLTDMSYNKGYYYATQGPDLITFSLEDNMNRLVLEERKRDIFEEPAPPDGLPLPDEYTKDNRPEGMVLVKWR